MQARAGPERHPGRGVALVKAEIEVDTQLDDADLFAKVDGEEVRLRAVALPVLVGAVGAEGGEAAGRFGGADGPGSEGGDLADVGRESGILGCKMGAIRY